MSRDGGAIKSARVEWSPELLRPAHWPTWLGLFALGLFGLLPRRLRFAFCAGLGELYRRSDRRRRHYVDVNLALCYPDLPEPERRRLARTYFRAYVQILFDLPLAWWGSIRRLRRRIEVVGMEHLEQARAGGRGVILLTGHVVGLDFGVLGLSRELPMVSVYNPFRNRVADWLMFRARTRFGLRLLARADGLRPVVRSVRAGEVLYYIPDEDLGPDHSVFAPFFGIPKASLPTLGRLARMCGAAVVPCTTCYDAARGRYRVHLLPALADYPGDDEAQDTARMNRALEELVALCPAQYMWGLRLFRTRPPGESPLYRPKSEL